MNIYLLTQNTNRWYDTYDGCVVTAESEEEARLILPRSYMKWDSYNWAWADKPEQVMVQCLWKANKWTAGCVILGSFNAW